VLHAVVARLAPAVRVIDLSHSIAPFDVAGGAALLARAVPHLGDGVVCAVVDPGVGGPRRAVALEIQSAGPGHLVGPDNGLLCEAADALGTVSSAVELSRDEPATTDAITFDGRDLFAPAAAALATGASLASLGTAVDPSTLVRLGVEVPSARSLPDGRTALTATVRWIDRFGNVQLSLDGDVLIAGGIVGVGLVGADALVRVASTFDDLEVGTAGVLRDANGAVALVVAQGSAAERFGLEVGDRVELVGDFGRIP
jgi:S-adenosylmethionine hydrolase